MAQYKVTAKEPRMVTWAEADAALEAEVKRQIAAEPCQKDWHILAASVNVDHTA